MNRLPIWFERVEGGLILFGASALYFTLGNNWLTFVLLFFIFDLSFAGYLAGPRVGAIIYNLAHTLTFPIILIALGITAQTLLPAASFGLIWLAHIGFDRALGYGLKYPDGFTHTTLGWIGKDKSKNRV
ncbi:DUF4260 family protein [Patescibacteria group bacterium]|nr:MAG: DUF4260 family protein [Patescibacteria group bacterium]